MIRSFAVAVFLASTLTSMGQIVTVLAKSNDEVKVSIPTGKYMEILGYEIGGSRSEGSYLRIEDGDASLLQARGSFNDPLIISIRFIAGPNTVVMKKGTQGVSVLTYRLMENTASSSTKSASPKADDIKLTDEFLMLDYTVQANTTYKLGISRDLKKWEPLFEFTPESDKLNVELPKIILGNEAFLKLE